LNIVLKLRKLKDSLSQRLGLFKRRETTPMQ